MSVWVMRSGAAVEGTANPAATGGVKALKIAQAVRNAARPCRRKIVTNGETP